MPPHHSLVMRNDGCANQAATSIRAGHGRRCTRDQCTVTPSASQQSRCRRSDGEEKILGARFTTRNRSIIIVKWYSRQADPVLPPHYELASALALPAPSPQSTSPPLP